MNKNTTSPPKGKGSNWPSITASPTIGDARCWMRSRGRSDDSTLDIVETVPCKMIAKLDAFLYMETRDPDTGYGANGAAIDERGRNKGGYFSGRTLSHPRWPSAGWVLLATVVANGLAMKGIDGIKCSIRL
ncbi:hypothetical protein EVAR_7715_1 [Eumeta japonica]|uniref:Uncharacterized protein n=1 Tax=Eumeta variegata TaxID=151549 RepID=A0A4C1TIC6_EUMVA|nr:hypothetical protein EVAR_7715_1 [Eumeta japonica]